MNVGFGFLLEWGGQAVLAATDRMEQRALKKIGFKTREDSMNSIRKGQGPSEPGTPPHDQVGTLRRFILYQIDKVSKSIVIGPKFLKKKSKDAPAALEKGGTAINAKGVPIEIVQRPFMVPAFERVKRDRVPAVFGNSLY